MGFNNGPIVTANTVGSQANGGSANLQLTSDKHLEVAIHEPVGAFGEVIVTELVPRLQIDGTYGILDTDHETLTSLSGLAYATTGSELIVETGTSAGGYGVIRSRRLARYSPGQGLRARFTAAYPVSASLGLCLAGMFNIEDGLFFGYSGTEFGILRRVAGYTHITRLTLTAGTVAAPETVTVTLNGSGTNVTVPANLTAPQAAWHLAVSGSFPDWGSRTSPRSNGSTLTFIQDIPGTATGTFGISSTGTISGTFSTLQSGAANDSVTGWIPQSQWNVDKMDGSATSDNPSGLLLDPTKTNVFEIKFPYLGAGSPEFRIMSPDGEFNTVHAIKYAGMKTTPNQKNPTFRAGWIAASLGSTTNLSVKGVSAAIFSEGNIVLPRDPLGVGVKNINVTTADAPFLFIRNRGEFTNRVNQREMYPQEVLVACETSNRIITAKVILNPIIVGGAPIYSYVSQNMSAIEYSTTTGISYINGTQVAESLATAGAPTKINLADLQLRLEPGDVLAIVLSTSTLTAVGALSVNWKEH